MKQLIPLSSRLRILAAFAASGALSFAACSAPVTEQPASTSTATVFEGARLITGDGTPPIENATFVVDGGRFTEVGTTGQVQAPAGAARVDLAGKTVMPGLINVHGHLAQTREPLVDQLRTFAYYGVVAVLSLGRDVGEAPFQVRDEAIPGAARLRTAGRGISAPEPGRPDEPHWVTSPDEARKAVQAIAATKPDIVKIWVDDRDGKYKKLTPALYGAIIEEAHKHDLRVIAHIVTLADAKGLLKAGLDATAHGVRDRDIDDDFMALLKARPDFVLVANLPDRGVATDLSWLSGTIRPDALKKMQAGATDDPAAQKAFGIQARNLAKMHAAGVRVTLGTDGSSTWAAHEEIADMVAAGLTPAQAIVAATRNAAEFLRLTDLGTVAAGKSADFIVLDANPLDEITNTRRIASVYLRGDVVDRAALSARLTGPETP